MKMTVCQMEKKNLQNPTKGNKIINQKTRITDFKETLSRQQNPDKKYTYYKNGSKDN